MIPNLFYKQNLPNIFPEKMQEIAEGLKKIGNKTECLKEAYNIVTAKYQGVHFNTYLRFFDLFKTDLEKIWKKNGFLHCTTMNFLIRAFLIKSGLFKESDIELKYSLVWYISIHQYLRVEVGEGQYINVDPWGKSNGIEFGDYARGFH